MEFLVGCLLSLDGKNNKTPKKSAIQLGMTSKPANLGFFCGGGGRGNKMICKRYAVSSL